MSLNTIFSFLIIILVSNLFLPPILSDEEVSYKNPTVFIAILVRNKAHTLPYFLTLFEKLSYPKDRIYLWIRCDHNIDESSHIMKSWLEQNQNKYHQVNSIIESNEHYNDINEDVADWSYDRYTHIINLREEALHTARKVWSDFILFLDADVLLTNPNTLNILISKNYPIVGPMLKSDGLYSNFWCGMSDKYYYIRTEEYEPILIKKNIGCHKVPMVHTCVLINLNAQKSDEFTFVRTEIIQSDTNDNKININNIPHDDIITFALSANISGVPFHVCNDQHYGYVTVPLEKDSGLSHDIEQLINIKLQAIVETDDGLPVSNLLSQFIKDPIAEKMDLDEIYVINLERRPERKIKMVNCTRTLGLDVKFLKAVDGRKLNDTSLKELGVTFLPGYVDPYHKRPMKKGEIGCFLSHHTIWAEVAQKNYSIVMVLEDDVRFESFFKQKLEAVLEELENLSSPWDIIYLGRKKLSEKEEPFVKGSSFLVEASYSYWTLGYLLSQQGARKLIDAKPLSNLIPVDEFLPLLSGKHAEKKWEKFYPKKNLITWSTYPLVLYPAKYLNEEGYVSDTEDSPTAITTPEPPTTESMDLLSSPTLSPPATTSSSNLKEEL